MKTNDSNSDHHFHSITPGSSITISHLIAIIGYCDHSDLCTDFSSTFRQKHPFETIPFVIKRNSKYFHFSKLLIELVTDYGINGIGDEDCEWEYEQGPFFTGINVVINIPEFSIMFSGPCSSSKQIAIATNFASRNGMILEIQNDGFGNSQSFLIVNSSQIR